MNCLKRLCCDVCIAPADRNADPFAEISEVTLRQLTCASTEIRGYAPIVTRSGVPPLRLQNTQNVLLPFDDTRSCRPGTSES